MANQNTETKDTIEQEAAKKIVAFLNSLSLPQALQACDIAKAWLPAQSCVQSQTPPH